LHSDVEIYKITEEFQLACFLKKCRINIIIPPEVITVAIAPYMKLSAGTGINQAQLIQYRGEKNAR
jgi:hypothetical protein